MRRVALALFTVSVFTLSGVGIGQDSPAKKDDPKEPLKAKGYLPMNWKDLGLTDEQRQKVYTIQNKYGTEIDKLEVQIKELKAKMGKERLEVLSAEQKKRLEDIYKSKIGK